MDVLPPPSIGYLQSAIKDKCKDVQVEARDLDEAYGLLERNKYDLVGVTFHSFSVKHAREIRQKFKGRLICGGHHPTALPEQMLSLGYDQVVLGEGENAIIDVINGNTDKIVITTERKHFPTINDIPFPDYTGLSYHGRFGINIISSRGCPFKCLQGDTLIDTTDGYFKIKDLVGKQPNVLTRNPITHDPEYAQVKEVRLTQTGAKLLRVNFDNGDYIDCTPDHRFITFKNGNQNSITTEKETEASDLKIGQSVRAIHYDIDGHGYIDIVWGRRKRRKQHRLIVENRIGRKLRRDEHIHHDDRHKYNNVNNNLILTSPSHHIDYHPEVAERMRTNNAAKDMSHEQRVANGKSQKGKKRTLESRINYRNSKLGDKNPNYAGGSPKTKLGRTRIKEINHKITGVDYLEWTDDVYCMEVPGYDWFYANQVLVHNCSFCASSFFWGHKYKMRSAENVIKEITQRRREGFNTWIFEDDNFTAHRKRVHDICSTLDGNLKWECQGRAEDLTEDLCTELYNAGCRRMFLGIESFSQPTLDRCNKNTTVEKMIRGIETAEKIGIKTTCLFIVGLPGDTIEDIQETHRVRSGINMFEFGVNIAWVLPGTEIHAKAKEKGFDDNVYLTQGAPFYCYEQSMETLNQWEKII